jgi:hypothetical protein
MPASTALTPYVCTRCIRATQRVPRYALPLTRPFVRRYADTATRIQEDEEEIGQPLAKDGDKIEEAKSSEKEEGAMTRRFRAMSEEALEADPRSASKTVEAAGFSEDLKRELEERIASANFRTENRSAFAEIELSSRVGRGSRDIATAEAWTGQESIHDASLRMLADAHKPLRVPSGGGGRIPRPNAPLPRRVDTGRTSRKGQGVRLADARDRSGLYSSLKDSEIDEQEKEKRFQELKDRFSPNARAVVPGTVQGLTNLANQRIEDAIARGQFKNISMRGKKMERDYNMSNPFLDTTEYFLNKMIQKQEIVPPWIEKQQELVSAATKFRTRLRLDWKRHAARMIASAGGSLNDQIRRAEAYAKAEAIANPTRKKEEVINTVENAGHVSQISLSGELKVPSEAPTPSLAPSAIVIEEITAERTTLPSAAVPEAESSSVAMSAEETSPTSEPQILTIPLTTPPPSSVPPAPYPYRDPAWEALESSYHKLNIESLNSITRSYNLQAPDLAKKPYFSLARELRACYADVAPLIAGEIRDRALGPKARVDVVMGTGGGKGVLEGLVGEKSKIRDEIEGKRYGFRQLWKDVFGAV